MFKFNEISKSSIIKEKEVVKVIGYNESIHLRKKGNLDLGGAIIDSDGNYWNVISTDGNVCYSDFGAKLDGTTFDTEAILKAHEYCNKNNINIKIKVKNAKIYFDRLVDVKTSIDFNNSTLLLTDLNKKGQYRFSSDDIFKEIDIKIDNLNNTLIKYNEFNVLPPNTVIRIDDLTPYSIRQDTTPVEVYRKELLYHTMLGSLLYSTIGNFERGANLKFFYRGVDSYQYIKNLKIISQMSPQTVGVFSINISRDNFLIENIIVDPTIESMILEGNENYKGSLINIANCFNTTIRNIVGNNITGLNKSLEYKGRSGYVLSFNNVGSIFLDNVNLDGAWGAIGSNNVNNSIVENSKLNRFDVHLYCKDITIRDTIFYDLGLMLGDAHGEILVENCKYYVKNRVVKGILFNSGSGYGSFAPGNFTFKNIEVYLDKQKETLFYLYNNKRNNFRGEKKIGNLFFENITINYLSKDKDIFSYAEINVNEHGYYLGDVYINNIKYDVKNSYIYNLPLGKPYFTELKNVVIKNTIMSRFFKENEISYKEYFGDKGYVPNNKTIFSLVTGGVLKLNLLIKNSSLFLIHDKFERLTAYDSSLYLDLSTWDESTGERNLRNIKIISSIIDITITSNFIDPSVGIVGGFTQGIASFSNCLFKLKKMKGIKYTALNTSSIFNHQFIACSLDSDMLQIDTSIVNSFKFHNNFVFKNYYSWLSEV